MRLRLTLGIFATLAGGSALAWNDSGHMTIAEIARQSVSPKILAECEWLLKQSASDPKNDSFLTAACWADDTRSRENGPWHYINIHFRTDGKTTDNQPAPQNVVWAIQRFSNILKDKRKDPRERGEALRYLLHFVGDLHQPLHAVARDSDEHPEGDRGGNEFKLVPPIKFKDQKYPPDNLHSLWDMGCGLFSQYSPRPLSNEGHNTVSRLANSIKSRFPQISLSNLDNTDPMSWAQESADLAKRYVYALKENEVPSPEYLKQCEDISAKRVATAGYRLAALLNRLMA